MPKNNPSKETGYVVYILACADGTLYTGCARDLARRLTAHNTTRAGAKYTRARRPVELVYKETAPNRSAALRREAEIKRLARWQKMDLILCSKKAPDGA